MGGLVCLTLLLLGLAAESGAAPTDNSGALAITGSSDAWASLVANVVPLLILVGEKHVKAYFKCLSQPSQLFLYAASPIGLVTAMVTMIRLGNSPLMKRLIGRQFESRAEVLADVSSISGGSVGFELRGPRRILEQTINPEPKDEANFWIQGRKSGTGSEGLEFGAEVEAVVQKVSKSWNGVVGNLGPLERFRNRHINAFMILLWKFESRFRDLGDCPYEGNGTVTSLQSRSIDHSGEYAAYSGGIVNNGQISGDMSNLSRNYQGTVLTVFDASGEDAQDAARLYAAQFATYRAPRNYIDAGLKNAVCESRSLAYLSWRDVSETLTTNANVKYRILRASRNMVALVCVLINVMITTLNWYVTRNIMTTSFISLGLAGSSLTSFWTAVLVSRSTSQETVSMEGIRPFRAGFWSTNFPQGVRLGYSPKQVVLSVEREMTTQSLALENNDWITPASVSMTALAFILLYLGLRAAEWWVPFAMFANVAFATCMRATLTTYSPMIGSDWYQPGGAQWCPDPFSHTEHNWLLHIWRDLRSEPEESALNRRQSNRKSSSVANGAAGPTKRGAETTPVPEAPDVNSPKPISPKAPPPTSNLKQEDRAKLLDASHCSEGCWTILSTCDKGARADPNGETLGVKLCTSFDGFMETVYEIAAEVERRNLVVTESKLNRRFRQDKSTSAFPQPAVAFPQPAVEFVRSEFISQNGIWQQSLEIAITTSAHPVSRSDDALLTLLRAWTVEALLGGKVLSKSKSHNKISPTDYGWWDHGGWESNSILHFGHDLEAIKEEIAMEDFWNYEDSMRRPGISFADLDPQTAMNLTSMFWSKRWMLWMALKIQLALCRLGKGSGRGSNSSAPDRERTGLYWIPGYVDFLEAVELLSSEIPDSPAKVPTHLGCASSVLTDETGSVQGVRSTQPSGSSSHRKSTSSERYITPQASTYMSFG